MPVSENEELLENVKSFMTSEKKDWILWNQ